MSWAAALENTMDAHDEMIYALRGDEPTQADLLDREKCLKALLRAREGYACEELTGLPVLPQWRERTLAMIDEALQPNTN
jgi:hypothetical protein